MENKTKSKIWVILYLSFVLIALGVVGGLVIYIDPFFHYHKSHVDD